MRSIISINEINEAMSCKVSAKNNVVAGMVGTMFVGSDRYPIVVATVFSPKHIKIADLPDAYLSKLIKNNEVETLPVELFTEFISRVHELTDYTLRKNGRWMPKGEGMWGTCSVHLGHADSYLDPDF